MSITIGNYSFDGPHESTDPVQSLPGLYAILDHRQVCAGPVVLDIGESGDVRSRLDGHDRKDQWRQQVRGRVSCAVLYTQGWTDQQRRDTESHLRQVFCPPCGDR